MTEFEQRGKKLEYLDCRDEGADRGEDVIRGAQEEENWVRCNGRGKLGV